MKIVTKYILKEHFTPLMFSLSALTSLLLLNYIAKRLGELVGKGLPWNVIAEFLLLSVPFTIAMTLPMAILVATLHAFSRMAAENEITAFKASGMSLQRMMVPVIIAGFIMSLAMIIFNDQVLPRANYELTRLTNDIARKKPTFALKENIINEVSPQKLFLRTARLTKSNWMHDVTIYDITNPQARRTIRADSGTLGFAGNNTDLKLTLFDGNMVETNVLDQTRLQRLFFHTDVVIVRGIANSFEANAATGDEKGDREMSICELQQRVHLTTRERDSSFAYLQAIDPTGKHAKQRKVVAGTGNVYCQFLKKLKQWNIVSVAGAAELPQGVAQQGTVPPASTPPAIQQGTTPAVPQGALPQSAAQQQIQIPVQAPVTAAPVDSHTVIMPPPQPAYQPLSIKVEPLKIQISQMQYTIDGDQVEIEKKFAIAMACVIFVLLGAPIALRFPRGGVGLTLGVSLGVFALYYAGLTAGESLARHGLLSPFLAMWAANFILLAVGIFLTSRLGREGTTSRGSEASEWLQRVRDRVKSVFARRTPA